MPYTKCNTKASRSAGLSHLLEPGYSSSNQDSECSAYLDCGGQLHDPDYRHFELPGYHSHLNSYTKPKPTDQRFAWELEAAALSGDEEEEIISPRRRSFSSEYSSPSSHSSPSWPASPTLLEEDVPYSQDLDGLPQEALTSSPLPPRGDSPSVALRKQWLALELRVRFKAYRVKNRLTKR